MRKRMVFALIAVLGCGKSVLEVGADGGPAAGATGTGGASGTGVASPWQGNAGDCPTDPPQGATPAVPGLIEAMSGDVCELEEGQSCAYWYTQNGYQAYTGCTCYEENRSVKRWVCDTLIDGLNACPMVEPTSGSDCFGHVGTNCPFPPKIRCNCQVSDANPQWSCKSTVGVADSGVIVSSPTDTSAAGKRIKDLSAADASAWCAWYGTLLQNRGAPAPDEVPVGPNGYISVGALYNWDVFGNACMAMPLAPGQCVQNLELLHCEATLGELNDCVMTLVQGLPQPHGCGRFLEAASCDGTIVRRAALSSSGAGGAGGYAGGQNPNAEANCGSLRVR